MKKDLEMDNTKITETFQEQSEENMEEILASIRKIMDPSHHTSETSQPYSKPDHHPSLDSLKEITEGMVTEKKHLEEVLVLTKKTASKNLSTKESLSQKPEKEDFFLHPPKTEKKSSLESLVSSSLSPLIQVWLEKHLPNIVEKVVKEEIKKLLDPNSKSSK